MALKSWVKAGGVWKEPIKLWANVNGTWKQITKGFVNVSGTWKQIYQLGDMLYRYGTEVVAWSVGYSDGNANATQAKESDCLHASSSGFMNSTGNRTWVTSAKFDVTNYSKIVLEAFLVGGYSSSSAGSYIQLAIAASNTTYKDADMTAKVYEGVAWAYSKNVRLELDVSAFTGTYYINIQNWGGLGGGTYPNFWYWNYDNKVYQVYAVK